MSIKRIAILPGDGIGPEVMHGALQVLKAIELRFNHTFYFQTGLIGGCAVDKEGTPLPKATIELCKDSDAILLGAVGGPKWDQLPSELRPEKGLLQIRKTFELYANIRPVAVYPSLSNATPFKKEVIEGVDIVILRELTGGLYFGEPKYKKDHYAVDTLSYSREEIERIVEQAFTIALQRNRKVTSVDKANVLESSKLWRDVVQCVAEKFPTVEVDHMLVDAAAMQLIRNPRQFDVIVTENMFGDILSDEASILSGSLGMLPSASIASGGFGLYEPVHGSAPDIAGQNKANPIGMILSAAMMLRHSFHLHDEAAIIENAVKKVLDEGCRTADLAGANEKSLGTSEIVNQIIQEIEEENLMAGIIETYA
jgi:3-isopropylmalate dehydrogenase